MAIGMIPNWLSAPDTLGALSSGAGAGASAARLEQESRFESARLGMEAQRMQQATAFESARLNQAAEQSQMEFQARQKVAQQEQLRQQQRLNIEAAYKTAELGIAKGRLEQAQATAAEKAKAAALQYQREQAFAQDVASGMPVMQAYQRNPVSASVLNAASRGTSQDRPVHVGGSIVERNPQTGEWETKYTAPTSQKPIKVGKSLVVPNKQGGVDVMYTEKGEGDALLGTALNFKGQKTTTKPTENTSKDRITRAHALGIAHPDWTKEQIIDAVMKEMP